VGVSHGTAACRALLCCAVDACRAALHVPSGPPGGPRPSAACVRDVLWRLPSSPWRQPGTRPALPHTLCSPAWRSPRRCQAHLHTLEVLLDQRDAREVRAVQPGLQGSPQPPRSPRLPPTQQPASSQQPAANQRPRRQQAPGGRGGGLRARPTPTWTALLANMRLLNHSAEGPSSCCRGSSGPTGLPARWLPAIHAWPGSTSQPQGPCCCPCPTPGCGACRGGCWSRSHAEAGALQGWARTERAWLAPWPTPAASDANQCSGCHGRHIHHHATCC
jgi:hypothetical protein